MNPYEGPTLSKEEALFLLRLTRAWLIEEARLIAIEQIVTTGSTHARLVLAEMERQGMLKDLNISDHWLGAVFNMPTLFKWTGDLVYVEASGIDRERGKLHNIHRRPIKVWTLATDDSSRPPHRQ